MMIRALAIVVAVSQLCGCHYARRWSADSEPPEKARIISASEARKSRERPTDSDDDGASQVATKQDKRSRPWWSRGPHRDDAAEPRGSDGDSEFVQVKSEARDTDRSERSPEYSPTSARGRWDSLLESFGRPRRIPLPRTDIDEPSEPEPAGPDFDGV